MSGRPPEPRTPFTGGSSIGGCLGLVLLTVWLVAAMVVIVPADTDVPLLVRVIAGSIVVVLTVAGLAREYHRKSPNHSVQLGVSVLCVVLVLGIVVFSGGLVGETVVMTLVGSGMMFLDLGSATFHGLFLQRRYRRGDDPASKGRSTRDE